MWDNIWTFALEHYIFHTTVIACIIFLIFNRKYKVIEISKNGFKLEKGDEIKNELKQNHSELDDRLNKIELSINRIIKKLSKVSQGTLENMLFDDRQSDFKRLKAFRRLLAMGVNGDIKLEGTKLVLAKKDVWKIVLHTKLNVKIKDQKYYEESLAYINRLVFDKL